MAALAAAQKSYLESRLSFDEDDCMDEEDEHGIHFLVTWLFPKTWLLSSLGC